MSNKMIISEFNNIDLYSLNDNQVKYLAANIIEKINLTQLKEEVMKTCLKLTGVGEPTWNADVKFIALDNQKRLELTYLLLNNFNLFEKDVKNFRRNKLKCRENDEYIFNFLFKTKDLISSIIEYGEFRVKELKENQKELLKYNSDILLID